jgi:hypothetical protein
VADPDAANVTIHILLDPSGAYLALEYSLVCSHLESLAERIGAHAPHRCNDARKWQAYHAGEADGTFGATVKGRPVVLEVRKTDQHLIMGRAA